MLSSFSLNAKSLEDFSLPIYDSEKTFQLKNERSKGLVVLNFWATWCTACIKEIPVLENLKKTYSNKAQFFAINAGDKSRDISKFIKKHGFTFTILSDKDKSFSKGLNVLELPRTMVIDKKGVVIYDSDKPPAKL